MTGLSWTDTPRKPAQFTQARGWAHPNVDRRGRRGPTCPSVIGKRGQWVLWVLGRITAVNWNMDRWKYNNEFKTNKKISVKYVCVYKNIEKPQLAEGKREAWPWRTEGETIVKQKETRELLYCSHLRGRGTSKWGVWLTQLSALEVQNKARQ